MATRHGRPTQVGTPGRRTNVTDNQYFDIGRVGRKTGITLKDTGIRDDYGLEPVSGIFSSGGSRESGVTEYDDDSSADMDGLDSPGVDVSDTLQRRKDPRLSQSRTLISRKPHANASPDRQSSVLQESPVSRQLANRRIDVNSNRVHVSIEKQSPFKPRHVLRRSNVGDLPQWERLSSFDPAEAASPNRPRRERLSSFDPAEAVSPNRAQRERLSSFDPAEAASPNHSRRVRDASSFDPAAAASPGTARRVRDPSSFDPAVAAASTPNTARRQSQKQNTQKRTPNPIFVDDDSSDAPGETFALPYATGDEIEGALGDAGTMLQSASPVTPRKRQLEQAQQQQQARTSQPRLSMGGLPFSKRVRLSPPEENNVTFASRAAPSSNQQSAARAVDENIPYDDYNYDNGDNYEAENDRENGENQDHRDNYDYGDDDDNDAGSPLFNVPESEDDVSVRGATPPTRPVKQKVNGKGKERARDSPPRRVRVGPAPTRRRRDESVDSYGEETDSGSDSSYGGGKKRKGNRGTRSNVDYRATTPFDDADQKTTRSGRAVMKPLNWWEGETVIWKNGEVEGVIRATSVEPERRVVKKRAQHKKKTEKLKKGLDAIDEQDEDQLPSDWEEEIGVMTGDVAQWDTQTNTAIEEELVTEDIAFAASSITLRSINGATFNFAKIQTLPFFGSGVVEIPPGGVKNMKNSRKMQMNFFVHKGKVQVTLTTPTSASTSIFSITEGGAWIVPRGNNYIINNHSSSTTAFLFFSQGCEVLAEENGG